MLRKFIEKFRIIKKVLKGEKGYTLVEVTAVVAITSALAAVIIPVVIDKVEQGKMSAAKQDVSSLAGIVQNIFNDTGDYPTRDTPGSANPAYPARSTTGDDVFDMLITTNPNDSVDEAGGNEFKMNVLDIVGLDTNSEYLKTKDLFAYHAITNGPPNAAKPRYEADEWAGPYMAEDKLDPWGNSYVIYVEPLQERYRRDLKAGFIGPNGIEPYRSAWVLSGGPNQVIETVITDSSIQNDDIGTKIK